MIDKELHKPRHSKRCEQWINSGNNKGIIGKLDELLLSFKSKDNHMAKACFYFLSIRNELWIDNGIKYRKNKNRHLCINKGKRPMLEFSCRIAVSKNI